MSEARVPDRRLFGGKSPQPIPLVDPLPHMEEWLDNLYADEVSTSYINMARLAMVHFANFVRSEEPGIRHPDEIHRTHLLRYQAWLTTQTRADGNRFAISYRQQLMKTLRNWVNWMLRLDYITRNPWTQIKIGTTAKVAHPLEDEEVALIFDAHRQQAFSINPFFYHRRETILVLLYGWGLRLGELASLTTTAMDGRLNSVTVRNKARAGSGNREKILPYSDELKLIVMRYLQHRSRFQVPGEDALFIDQQGRPLTTHHLRKIITDLGTRAGVQINPHRLRDTYATTLVASGVEIEFVMKLMGHSRREQVMAYTKVPDARIHESHGAVMNPMIVHLTQGNLAKPKETP